MLLLFLLVTPADPSLSSSPTPRIARGRWASACLGSIGWSCCGWNQSIWQRRSRPSFRPSRTVPTSPHLPPSLPRLHTHPTSSPLHTPAHPSLLRLLYAPHQLKLCTPLPLSSPLYLSCSPHSSCHRTTFLPSLHLASLPRPPSPTLALSSVPHRIPSPSPPPPLLTTIP